MKILITGAKGFIGKNLVTELRNQKYTHLFEYDKDTDQALLEEYTKDCNFVFHLAGVNRPKDEQEFMSGNLDITAQLLKLLKGNHNKSPILMTSSVQASRDTPYGISKKASEDLLLEYSQSEGVNSFIYRLPNVFGKWCKPHYNSVVATFCNNIAYDLPIHISNPSSMMDLVYIDDVVEEFIGSLRGYAHNKGQYYEVPTVHKATLREIASAIKSFRNSRQNLMIPSMSDPFIKKLYSTYLSYLPVDQFSYPLKMNVDDRGSFTEFIRTPDRGQISVNILKAGIQKGNHWHHTKNEKFLVVSGRGSINLRQIDSEEILTYTVSGDQLEVIDIPVGYTHNIVNEGTTDMVTVMWVNSPYDPTDPDTYFIEV